MLPGCSTVSSLIPRIGGPSGPPMGQPGFVRGFLGGVVADEPRAAIVARDVLSAGGSAVDAAVAGALTMSVTLPSRVGLGGGGACLIYNVSRTETEVVAFPAGGRSAALPAGTDRPAAIPMMPRGLFALYTRGGRLRFEELIRPAEDLARLGTEISRAFASDLAAVSGPLLADPNARIVFGRPGGGVLTAGDRITQLDLGATLGHLRAVGVGDLYQGGFARRLEEASAIAGGGLTAPELRAAQVQVVPPATVRVGNDIAAFIPPGPDGGAGTAAAFQAQAGAQGAGFAGGGAGNGASASLVAVDREGNAVSCAFSMNNLFGTGRVAPGTGILLAAAPDIGQVRPAPLAAAVVSNANLRSFRAAVAGSGQQAAGPAVAGTLAQLLRNQAAEAAIEAGAQQPGRANAISCPRYLPANNPTCTAGADPRGGGVALGSFQR